MLARCLLAAVVAAGIHQLFAQPRHCQPSVIILNGSRDVASVNGFSTSGFVPLPMRLRAVCAGPARARQQASALALQMYEGTVSTWIKRNFGETFFLAGTYENDFSKEWSYTRTYTDFVKLDRAVKKKYPDQTSKLPPKPYLVGEESSFMPFQKYIEKLLSIPGAYEDPAVYEFLGTPPDVITAAFQGRVPIDIVAEGGRYTGEKSETGKYVPTLDPVMMAEGAGKGVRDAKQKLQEAEISKKAGAFAADKTNEWKEVAAPAVDQVKKSLADSGVSSKSVGAGFGGMLANLKSGRGLFGEEATMAAVSQATAALEDVMDDGTYTEDDKWDLTVQGPEGEALEVTVRPTQKARLLLKAWLAEAAVSEAEALAYALDAQGQKLTGDEEIGQVLKAGAAVRVVKS